MRIIRWMDLNPTARTLAREKIREIFFLSAERQNFANSEEKEAFFQKWTGFYFDHEPEWIFLAMDSGEQVQGYLMGCPESVTAIEFYKDRVANYSLYADLFPRFPAHLHINCHPKTRGFGMGTKLIQHFCDEMKKQGCAGVHIVTIPESRNRSFYLRAGFVFEELRLWKDRELLFMGRNL